MVRCPGRYETVWPRKEPGVKRTWQCQWVFTETFVRVELHILPLQLQTVERSVWLRKCKRINRGRMCYSRCASRRSHRSRLNLQVINNKCDWSDLHYVIGGQLDERFNAFRQPALLLSTYFMLSLVILVANKMMIRAACGADVSVLLWFKNLILHYSRSASLSSLPIFLWKIMLPVYISTSFYLPQESQVIT